ncbi:hypothetical protein EC844_101168 [Acinetobacter calcoaceticus]|uniref:CENP-V/GFA domain-containing protein n=1 Tax=Acinetobacter calcoaceticus TaxID=471 RepID=A0A4R1Y1C1_ACICA|nr:hypothetical protein EC844_101168 [Acinetobacter calcoaceticus]
MTTKKYTGSCLCGAVRYEILGEIGPVLQCHCQRCRKANGSAYATNAPVKVADFSYVQGAELIQKYQSTPTTQRCFCGVCASPIISIKSDTPELYRLRIGTLDTPLEHGPTQHIFVASKAEWEQICDQLPQYAERP